MMFPLDFWDISLLIAVLSVVLLVTSEMLSMNLGKINILIDRKKLRYSAIASSVLFSATVALRIAASILNF
jgi:hypothetical protein